MSCRDPYPTPAPRGAHSYHSCLATPPFRPCRTGGPFSDTRTVPRTRIPERFFSVPQSQGPGVKPTLTDEVGHAKFQTLSELRKRPGGADELR